MPEIVLATLLSICAENFAVLVSAQAACQICPCIQKGTIQTRFKLPKRPQSPLSMSVTDWERLWLILNFRPMVSWPFGKFCCCSLVVPGPPLKLRQLIKVDYLLYMQRYFAKNLYNIRCKIIETISQMTDDQTPARVISQEIL